MLIRSTLLLIILLSFIRETPAQRNQLSAKEISINLGQVPLLEVISFIENNYDIHFSYTNNLTALNQKVDVNTVGTLRKVLDDIFENSGVEYKILNNKVALRLKGRSSENTLSGKVVDHFKEPVSLAHVFVKNYPEDGTVANSNGNFKILVSPSMLEDTLTFSAVGYFKFTIPIREFMRASPRYIFLTEHRVQLDNVIVTAAKGITPRQIIKKAIKNLKDKLPDSPYGTRFHYRDIMMEDGQFGQLLESVVDLYDLNYRRWYSKNSIFMDFQAVRKSEDYRKFPFKGGPKWRNNFTYNEGYDIQLNYDYYNEMRFRKRILDKRKLDYWKYSVIDTIEVADEELLVIDAMPKENVYEARIYVKNEDYTITRIETDYSTLLNQKHPFFGGYDQIPVILPHQFGPLIEATDSTYTVDDSLKFVYQYKEIEGRTYLDYAIKKATASVYNSTTNKLITTHASINELNAHHSIDTIPEKIRNADSKWNYYYWYGYNILDQIKPYDPLQWENFSPHSSVVQLPLITQKEFAMNSARTVGFDNKKIKKPNEKHFQSKFQKWKLLQAEKLFIERDNGITDLNKKGKAIDSLFHYLNKSTPGVALAVIQNQKPIIEKFYGRAKLNSGESISGSTVFRMASIAKQFVAMAILLLEERHKLKLNDDIRKYLPELPQYKDTIRITHLLNNTSGLDDPITEEVWSGGGYESTDKTEWSHLTNEYALSELINKGPELAVSPPGSLYNYNNAGYSLLALIIEKVSGQSIQNYGKTNIFMPLGMNNTYFDTLPSHKSKYKAQGYIKQENSFIPYEWKLTATGALMSTLNDLYLWEANFHKNKLGEKDPLLTRKMLENTVVVDGEVRYGLGLFLFQYAGEMVFGHDGDALSYTTNLWMFPELGLSIILLSNISREFHDSEKLTGKVASILLDVD